MSPLPARLLVFSTSAAVLVIEILAVRLLAPYLGVSLEVFTGIIGVILAGISLGAWLGGRAADRVDPRSLPGPLLVGGGLTALAAPVLIDLIGSTLSGGAVSIVLASVIGFFAPAAFLSAVPPVVVKIRLASLDQTGTIVGTYSAIGTAGAIFGTFVTGFVLIAAFPTRPIVLGLGIALTITGLVVGVARRAWMLMSVAVGGVLSLLLILPGPCDRETKYHCAIVAVDPDRPSGRTLVLDRLRNSYVDLADPTYLEFRYIRLMADVIETHSPDGPLRVLSIGGGGFTMPGFLASQRPGTVNVVLEIDPQLVEIGRDQLALSDDVTVMIGDARTGITEIEDDSVDVVIGDAYSGASVPWHLTTVEFTQAVARAMRPQGVYTMNVIDFGALEFARAEARTLRAVFPHVALLAPDRYLSGEAGGNFVFVASEAPIDLAAIEETLRERGGTESGITGLELTAFIGDAPLLTDDFAPVDQMLGRS